MNGGRSALELIVVPGKGIKFINNRLEAWFNLCADPDGDGKNWYAGSATSVLLDGKEELDPFRAELPWLYMCHDRQKRCMQIDEVCLYDTSGENPIGSPVKFATGTYDLESHAITSDRVTATIASMPFAQEHDQGKRFRLFRTISLQADADILTEEVAVRELTGESGRPGAAWYFSARYFTYIAFRSVRPHLYRNPRESSHYVAVGYPCGDYGPYPGYGYASDVAICDVMQPDGRFRSYAEASDIGTVSWTIGPCQLARGLHLFTRYERDFESRIRDCSEAIPSIEWSQLRLPTDTDKALQDI